MDNRKTLMIMMTIALVIWAVFFITELQAEETFEYTDEIHLKLCYENQRIMSELTSLGYNVGDFEQRDPSLYQITNYLELYIMAGSGQDRKHIQILNKNDPCCFSVSSQPKYVDEIQKLQSLPLDFELWIDESHNEHKISTNINLGCVYNNSSIFINTLLVLGITSSSKSALYGIGIFKLFTTAIGASR